MRNTDTANCLVGSNKQTAQFINGTFFAILFLLMVVAAVPLCKVIHKVGLTQKLSSNVRWVTVIFALFMFGFLSRAIYDYATTLNGNYLTVYLGLALPLFWDFLPIFLMSLMHYRD